LFDSGNFSDIFLYVFIYKNNYILYKMPPEKLKSILCFWYFLSEVDFCH